MKTWTDGLGDHPSASLEQLERTCLHHPELTSAAVTTTLKGTGGRSTLGDESLSKEP